MNFLFIEEQHIHNHTFGLNISMALETNGKWTFSKSGLKGNIYSAVGGNWQQASAQM